MDVQRISRATGVRVPTLRYLITHRVVPWARGRLVRGRPGRQRNYDPFEAFALAAAGRLFESGMRRELAGQVVEWLYQTPWPSPRPRPAHPLAIIDFEIGQETALSALYGKPGDRRTVAVGDARALRVQVGPHDTGWFDPDTRLARRPYRPEVLVRLDLTALRAAIAAATNGGDEE